jgi:hypothetical protein
MHKCSALFPEENKVLGFMCVCVCVCATLSTFVPTKKFHKICYEHYATIVYVFNNGFCIFYR